MNTSFKKELLDVCILSCINEEGSNAYQISCKLQNGLPLLDAELYMELKHLCEENCLTVWTKEEDNKKKKYFSLTEYGKNKVCNLAKDFEPIEKMIRFLARSEN